MKFRDFIIPGSLDEARSRLKELGDGAMPVAGGTALHFLAEHSEKTVVDITRLGLDGIVKDGSGFRIGAATTVALIQAFRAGGWELHRVARCMATQQIRNVSTIGGNIARVFPWADFPVALLALDASMTILGDREVTLPADEYFKSQPSRLYRKGEILTAVTVPSVGTDEGFGYHKEVLTSSGFSMMTAAALIRLEGKSIGNVRLAAGAGLSFPRRLTEVEEKLKGRPAAGPGFERAVADGAGGMKWKGKEGMSDEYAVQLAQVILHDVLMQALKGTKGAENER